VQSGSPRLLPMMLPVLVLALALQRSPADCSRRALLRRAATAGLANAAALSGGPARAIVNGDAVSDAEAAASGSVGLWIDLSGCSVCRKDKPATCSGTLVAPTLVLSARHCLDTPRMLNGTLERVVFGSDMFGAGASRDVVAVKSTSDYGIETAGNDLILLKLSSPAPKEWRVVELPLGLLPSKEEQEEARRKGSPFYPDGLGFHTHKQPNPSLTHKVPNPSLLPRRARLPLPGNVWLRPAVHQRHYRPRRVLCRAAETARRQRPNGDSAVGGGLPDETRRPQHGDVRWRLGRRRARIRAGPEGQRAPPVPRGRAGGCVAAVRGEPAGLRQPGGLLRVSAAGEPGFGLAAAADHQLEGVLLSERRHSRRVALPKCVSLL